MRIGHRLGVQATADRVWEIIAEVKNWDGWNPVWTGVSGRIGYGETLTFTETLPNATPRKVEAKVIAWTPNELLHLEIKEGFMTKRVAYMEIDGLAGEGCIFSCGAVFRGFSAGAVAKKYGRNFKIGMGTLGEAMKEKAERGA